MIGADTLARTGVWFFTDRLSAVAAAEFAVRIESLGFSSLWLPEAFGRDPFAHAALLLDRTERLVVATGIANIYNRHPGVMAQAANTLAEQSGRFVLGLGVSSPKIVEGFRGLDYSRPLDTMRHYLEGMERSRYAAVACHATRHRPSWPRLGPCMLDLAASVAAGAHTYNVTPEHTAYARSRLGETLLLFVEQKVLLDNDQAHARQVATSALAMYRQAPGYRANWNRLGFTDDEINDWAPRFVDAMVAWGEPEALLDRVRAHYDAGATHVCIQPLHPVEPPGTPHWSVLELLAPAIEPPSGAARPSTLKDES